MILAFAFKTAFFVAAWFLVRRFTGRDVTFLAVSLLIVTSGRYGAFNVFHYAEDWLTARSPAEALVLTALALHARSAQFSALLVGCIALVVHPLMALPGMLVLICLSVPLHFALWGAAGGIVGALGLASYGVHIARPSGLLALMDPNWLEVVRERSIFLLPQTWFVSDWKITARPLLSLTLCAFAIDDARVKKLCLSALLVGASGIAVALISSYVGPIATLLQGQAWRWVWVGACVGVLLVPLCATSLWNAAGLGPMVAALLVAGWIFDRADGALLISIALLIWLGRRRVSVRILRDCRWAAALVGAVVAAQTAASAWSVLSREIFHTGPRPGALSVTRDLLKLEPLALVLPWAFLWQIRSRRSPAVLAVVCAALLLAIGVTLPAAIHSDARVEIRPLAPELQEWRRVIPLNANVLVVPTPVSPTLAWFSLQRPSYLSIDQSSGVVFSRATAQEIRRRSEVVRPVWDSTWRLSSRNLREHGLTASSSSLGSFASLTATGLAQMCRDPALDFVVAQEKVGPTAAAVPSSGPWRDWNLYDCHSIGAGRQSP